MTRLVASMTTLRGPVPEMDAAGNVAGEALLPWLRDVPGFRGVMILTDEDRDTARVLTFWDSGEAAERSLTSRLQLRDRMAATAGMDVEATEAYVVSALELL